MPKFVTESNTQNDRKFAIRQAEAQMSGKLSATRHESITPWKTTVREVDEYGVKRYVATCKCKAVRKA